MWDQKYSLMWRWMISKRATTERPKGKTNDDVRCWTKIYSWLTACRSLLRKFFADENFLLYSSFYLSSNLNQRLKYLLYLDSSQRSFETWFCTSPDCFQVDFKPLTPTSFLAPDRLFASRVKRSSVGLFFGVSLHHNHIRSHAQDAQFNLVCS